MTAATSQVTTWEIVRWWELRRIPYNLAVGIIGSLSLVLMEIIGATIVKPGEDFEEPLAILFGSLAFGIFANVGYTLGWIFERRFVKGDADNHRVFRRVFFRLGLALSCALATLPMWVILFAWALYHITGGQLSALVL
jgi:hypothetical protein